MDALDPVNVMDGRVTVRRSETYAVDGLDPTDARASFYGSEGWGFESLRARKILQVKPGDGLTRSLGRERLAIVALVQPLWTNPSPADPDVR
jgi:hypothetical protein